jgi:hypothetical protein
LTLKNSEYGVSMAVDPANRPHLKEFEAFLSEFSGRTQRGSVLAASAYLDDQLLKVLEAFPD